MQCAFYPHVSLCESADYSIVARLPRRFDSSSPPSKRGTPFSFLAAGARARAELDTRTAPPSTLSPGRHLRRRGPPLRVHRRCTVWVFFQFWDHILLTCQLQPHEFSSTASVETVGCPVVGLRFRDMYGPVFPSITSCRPSCITHQRGVIEEPNLAFSSIVPIQNALVSYAGTAVEMSREWEVGRVSQLGVQSQPSSPFTSGKVRSCSFPFTIPPFSRKKM